MENLIIHQINAALIEIGSKAKSTNEEQQTEVLIALKKIPGLLVTDKKVIPITPELTKNATKKHFLDKPHDYIVVIGFAPIAQGQITRIAESYGFPSKNVRVEEIKFGSKEFPFAMCTNFHCRAVLVGPVSRKMKGTEGDNNPVSTLRRDDALIVHELKSGPNLKITSSTLRIGFEYVSKRIAVIYRSDAIEEKSIAISG